ncbi:hypothetical protein ASE07_06835 [Noviherbaspirillum sp. Root189]|nr:hypothetical protein ASE07_06835 [Noviherbaspirillum sp. Root189]
MFQAQLKTIQARHRHSAWEYLVGMNLHDFGNCLALKETKSAGDKFFKWKFALSQKARKSL